MFRVRVGPVFKRLNSSTGAISAREQIDRYFEFFNTKTALRPFIYRKKNANTLLAMDLKDPVTKEDIKPREPVASVSRTLLIDYIRSIPEGSNELHEWFKKWMNVTTRKTQIFNYFSPIHIQYMLIQSFFVSGDYARMVGFLYANKTRFIKAKNLTLFDVEHFFNTLLMCSLHRRAMLGFKDPEIAKRKVTTMWKNTYRREQTTGLAPLLLECYATQQNFDSTGMLTKLNPVDVNLPTTKSLNTENIDKFLYKNANLYLICRTLIEYTENNVNSTVQTFVEEYKTLNKEKKDPYDEYMVSMKKIWSNKKQELEERNELQTDTTQADSVIKE